MEPEIAQAAGVATRRRWDARYAGELHPWDTQITPPEVVAFWRSGRLPTTGRALDLGCGPGTNVRYLARLGLHAVGIEIAGAALSRARVRLQTQEPHLARRAEFVCADVCSLPFAGIDAAYILDVGCLHSLPSSLRPYYAAGVAANLAPGGYYHLYAFDQSDQTDPLAGGPSGLATGEVLRLIAPALTLVEEAVATPDPSPCRWYLLQRPTPA